MNSNPHINRDRTKFWYNEQGQLHRDDDFPAIEYDNGTKEWFKNDKRHREQDKPAVEYPNGDKEWWKNGQYLSYQEVKTLRRKWVAIRNGDTGFLAEELLNEL